MVRRFHIKSHLGFFRLDGMFHPFNAFMRMVLMHEES